MSNCFDKQGAGKQSFPAGFTLAEMAIVSAIIFMLIGSIFVGVRVRIDHAKGQAAVKDLEQIAEKSLQFYQSNKAWPGAITDLAPLYWPNGVTLNQFSQGYVFNGQTGGMIISTQVPNGAVNSGMGKQVTVSAGNAPGWDNVAVFKPLDLGASAGSRYDRLHFYCDTSF